jgi:Alpha/beta hydrolase family
MTFRSLVLVHGSGCGPWVFDGWQRSFPELTVTAVDLQAGLDVAHATLRDYAVAIVRAVVAADRPVAVCAWSLGGLAAMLGAHEARPDALILLEPSPPLEVQGLRDVVPRPGTIDPLAAGAPFPAGMAARPESSLATGERERGVSVPSLPAGTRTLVVAGDAYRDERGPGFAERYGGVFLDSGTAEHWDLVRDPAIRARIAAWLDEL